MMGLDSSLAGGSGAGEKTVRLYSLWHYGGWRGQSRLTMWRSWNGVSPPPRAAMGGWTEEEVLGQYSAWSIITSTSSRGRGNAFWMIFLTRRTSSTVGSPNGSAFKGQLVVLNADMTFETTPRMKLVIAMYQASRRREDAATCDKVA